MLIPPAYVYCDDWLLATFNDIAGQALLFIEGEHRTDLMRITFARLHGTGFAVLGRHATNLSPFPLKEGRRPQLKAAESMLADDELRVVQKLRAKAEDNVWARANRVCAPSYLITETAYDLGQDGVRYDITSPLSRIEEQNHA